MNSERSLGEQRRAYVMPSTAIRTGLAAAFLLLFASGCASTQSAAPSIPDARIPAKWLAPCPAPRINAGTNAGLAEAVVSYETTRRSCNGQLSTLREYLTLEGLVLPVLKGQQARTEDEQG